MSESWPPDPLDERERRALGLALLALGRYGQLAKVSDAFAHGGVRARERFRSNCGAEAA